MRPCPNPECKREKSLDDFDEDANPVKGFEERKEADAGAVPGRVVVVGRLRVREPGKGNKRVVPAVGGIADVVDAEDEVADDADWMGEGREAETTAERGGSDRGWWQSEGPDEVGGLEEGEVLEVISMGMEWLERKDWPGSRKEWFCS
jgi:hypothetical protein